MSKPADVIIIGGGIHGASTAFHLAERGLKALVIEKNTLASAATGRSSGLVRMHYDLEPESRLAWESFQYFRDWEARVGGSSSTSLSADCGFTRTGFIQIVTPGYEDQLRCNVAMHQQIGIPSLLVNADDVRRLAPLFNVDDIEVAAYEPESGYADPGATTTTLMEAARRGGARLLQGCTVTSIQVKSGKVIGVTTIRRRLLCADHHQRGRSVGRGCGEDGRCRSAHQHLAARYHVRQPSQRTGAITSHGDRQRQLDVLPPGNRWSDPSGPGR